MDCPFSTLVVLNTSIGVRPSGCHCCLNEPLSGFSLNGKLESQVASREASKALMRSNRGMATGKKRWKKSGKRPALPNGDKKSSDRSLSALFSSDPLPELF